MESSTKKTTEDIRRYATHGLSPTVSLRARGATSGWAGRCARKMKRTLPVLFAGVVVVSVCALSADLPDEAGWRKVLGFDVMAAERSHKADLGNHRQVVAGWESDLGWEIEVLNYGDSGRENLLYEGNNWHGAQPWMVFAWTKHQQTYPDVRDVSYDKGKSRIRIVLVDCQTRQIGSNSFEFVSGRIEVFHKP